jgi:hypothetical protein
MRSPILSLLFASILSVACGEDDPDDSKVPPGQDDTGPVDSGEDTDDTGDGPDEPDLSGELPPVPAQHGVIYAVHYGTSELFGYRIDGRHPRRVIEQDMGGECHDMALDGQRDLLFVVQDVGRRVVVLSADVPEVPGDEIDAPSQLATIEFQNPMMPLFVRVDPYHQRAYIAAASIQGHLEEMQLHVYDTSDPAAPQRLHVATIPVTTSWDIDPVRRVAFIVDSVEDSLALYDLGDDEVQRLPGDPVDLRALYPQENSWGFQARNLTVDPWHSRVHIARSQGALSELMVLDYPDPIPAGSTVYADVASHADLVMVPDWFDVDQDIDARAHLLDGFTPLPDPDSGAVFFLANAWNGTMSTALVVPMDAQLEAQAGCGDYEGIGCWLQSHYGGSAGSYVLTDGAACADWTNGVVAATSYDQYDATAPGALHLFSFDHDLGMEPWLEEDGSDLGTGGMPIALVCH